MSMLNSGPEKQAATAIVGCPACAMTTSATRSPTELPHARTVMPRMDGLMPMIVPSVLSAPSSSGARARAKAAEALGRGTAGLAASGCAHPQRRWKSTR